MSNHHLKTWPEQYQRIVDGVKRFEYRLDDRGFNVGDSLELAEFAVGGRGYTGRKLSCEVTYVLAGPDFGVPPGFVVMSLGEPVIIEAQRDAFNWRAWGIDVDVMEDGRMEPGTVSLVSGDSVVTAVNVGEPEAET